LKRELKRKEEEEDDGCKEEEGRSCEEGDLVLVTVIHLP